MHRISLKKEDNMNKQIQKDVRRVKKELGIKGNFVPGELINKSKTISKSVISKKKKVAIMGLI